MYSLSQSRRPKEEDDEDNRPAAPPTRQITEGATAKGSDQYEKSKASFAQYHDHHQESNEQKQNAVRPNVAASASRGSGRGVATAMMAARSTSSPKSKEDEAEVEDYAEDVDDSKAAKPSAAATTVGAVAVAGISAQTSPSTASYENEADMYQDSFVNRSRSAEQGQPAMPERNEPIVARCVADDEADIEAQVQSRMNAEAKDIADMVHKQIIASAAVAEAQPSVQDTSSLTTQDQDEITHQKKKKRLCIIAVAVLAIIAAIGAGVGVAVANKSEPEPPAPPPSPAKQCSFCYEGSTPPNLETNEVLGQSCAEYRQDQMLLDSTDSNCALGQALAFVYCGCGELPPRPENPTCTLCDNGATPSGIGCYQADTLVQHLAASPAASCDELRTAGYENGCTCPGDTPSGNTIDAFRTLLEPISGDTLNNENSPQFKALDWIANDDLADLSVGSTTDSIIESRYVAAVLYYSLGGESWTNQYNFRSDDDICTWKQSNLDGLEYGIICDRVGNVNTLRLPMNNLEGSIPQEIGYLTGLTTIEMANNTIGGALPDSLSNLSTLQHLDVTSNKMIGEIPEFLFTHQQLRKLLLNYNSFTGTVSSSLGTSPQLNEFRVRENQLKGSLPPSIGQSSVLGIVDFGDNRITGTIPDFLPSSNLWAFRLTGNDLIGTIPTSIGNLLSLEFFSVGGNRRVNGAIPSEIGQCQNLLDVFMYNTTMTGTIPTELGSLTLLETLSLDGNGFSGPIPSELGQCQKLVFLELYDNFLTGDVGPAIDVLPPSLESLGLAVNIFNSTFPTSIGRLTSLYWLNARSNNFRGNIPSELGLLTGLELLDLSENQFTGTVPTSLATLPLLKNLRFYENDLNGSLVEFCEVASETGLTFSQSFAASICEEDEFECPCCNQCCRRGTAQCQSI